MNTTAAAGPPLSLEFRRVQAISSRGNQRIRVTPAGELFAYLEQRDCPRGEDWSAPWPDEPLRRLSPAEQRQLASTLIASGFLELPRLIVGAGRDGFRDEIDAAFGPAAPFGDHRAGPCARRLRAPACRTAGDRRAALRRLRGG
jgi:hypothetical protein